MPRDAWVDPTGKRARTNPHLPFKVTIGDSDTAHFTFHRNTVPALENPRD